MTNLKQIADIYPLSPVQEELLRESLDSAASSVDHLSCNLKGQLHVCRLEESLQRVLNQNPILRTTFAWKRLERPMQLVHRESNVVLEQHDSRGMTRTQQEEHLAAFLQSDRVRGFNLARPPLLRCTLFRLHDDSHRFVFSYSRLLMDEWSLHFMLRDIFQGDQALHERREPGREQGDQFRGYVEWLKSRDLSATESFWRQALEGVAVPTPLSIDSGYEPSPSGRQTHQVHMVRLTEALTDELSSFFKNHQLSLDTLLEGAWSLLLSRYSGEEDIVFGITIVRPTTELAESDGLIGPLTNTLPLRVRVPEGERVLTLLKDLRAQEERVRRHSYSSLSQIRHWHEVPPKQLLFESVLAFDAGAIDVLQDGTSGTLEIQDVSSFGPDQFPLTLKLRQGPRLVIEVRYDARRFAESSIFRLGEHLRNILKAMAGAPEQIVRDILLLSSEEMRQLLFEWNQTETAYPGGKCIGQLFEQAAEQSPDAIAVSSKERDLSYRELNRRANQLAHCLRRFGVGPDVPVGICLGRSVEMIVAILGVLKAGGAYVPLDPAYPLGRLAMMLEESGVPLVLTQRRLADELPVQRAMTICLDDDEEILAREPIENLPSVTSPDNLAYIMYTSGSTGTPKGVCITHRGVVRLVKATNYVNLTAEEVIPQLAPLSFDASTFEIWGSLLNCARLVVLPEQTQSLEELGRVIGQSGVTTMWLTAGLFHQIVESNPESLRNVRQLLTGGDVLSARHVRRALEEIKVGRLINGYGPTENTTFTCCHSMTEAAEVGTSVSIGRPVSNTQVYILDHHLRPVPVGVFGELYAGGDGLARGYFNQPGLTAENFIPHPFSRQPGARLYKTGDAVRYLWDGRLEFLERLDNQVKIRGYRIEPGEVEAIIRQYPDVQEATVVAHVDATGEKKLVAYVVTSTAGAFSAPELRTWLREKLPEFMVPAAFMALEAMPLTRNGKVDRRAFPPPEPARPEFENTFIAPGTHLEQAMADIWAPLLGVERVGVEDNFFDIGGHSLLAVQLISRMRDAFQIEVPLRALFDQPTIAELAVVVERLLTDEVNGLTEDEALRELQSFERR